MNSQTKEEQTKYQASFVADVKKYIIPQETAEFTYMFYLLKLYIHIFMHNVMNLLNFHMRIKFTWYHQPH